jgi:polysaccharide biosynthesis protein PelE
VTNDAPRIPVPVAVLAAVMLVADAALLVFGIARAWPVAAVVAAHLTLAGLAGFRLLRSTWGADRYGALLVLTTVALGPLGPAGVLLAMVLERVHARSAVSIEQWHEMLFPPMVADTKGDLWRRIGKRASDRPADPRVTPFQDVLSFGSVQQRQAVVAIIAQQFRPAFAPALKAALRDEHNVVRVQAATVIARLEQEFLDRTFELEAAVQRAPSDPEAILALASHSDDQAFAGLFDATREEHCRARAAEGYERYLELRPDDQSVDLRLARLQLRRGLLDRAEPRLQRLADAGHASARLWLMEVLFAQRRYRDLRAVASRFGAGAADTMPLEAAGAIELWADAGVSA